MGATDDTGDKHDTPLRLFYALWPDEAVRESLQGLQMHVHGRHVQAVNLHITLAFLGNQPASRLPLLKNILADLPRDAFTLPIDRLGYFRKNRIAWAGSHAAPDALITLQASLAQTLTQHVIAFDSKGDFKPHVTLAREAEPPLDLPFDPFVWAVQKIALVQSLQQGGRLAYKVLAWRHLERQD